MWLSKSNKYKHMKKIVYLFTIASLLLGCKNSSENTENIQTQQAETSITPISDEVLETAIIYEANIRQYSPEGTFNEFTKDIPQLKELGVKIIWLMPIFPISETKRKATGGPDSKFASEFPEEEQVKYLGSYYAVTDFTKINPEFGTIEDFRTLIKTAHDNGIYVILDWVPNHTGWDHTWLKEHPEYYTQDEDGKVIHPEGTDWTDVADLNYDNQDMRNEMINDMSYWVSKEGVDGFRCDVAGSVPLNFWQQAIPKLRAQKDIFMLAEAWEPELLKGDLFDMAYAWDGHHTMNAIAKKEKSASEWKSYIEATNERYEADDILMNFVTNHDENSWNGTIKERMGDASELMTVLSYLTPGMPLIYSGQEYDLDHRLLFFEKDSFPHTKKETWALLKKLGQLKISNNALHGGKQSASYYEINVKNESVLAFERHKDNDTLVFIGNMSDKEQIVEYSLEGEYSNYMVTSEDNLSQSKLNPWEYKILIKK